MSQTAISTPPSTRILRVLQSLADDNRLRILEALREGERCVCELQTTLDMGQSLLSHHLRSLREAGLVSDRRAGRWVHYSVASGALQELEEHLAGLRTDAESGGPGGAGCVV